MIDGNQTENSGVPATSPETKRGTNFRMANSKEFSNLCALANNSNQRNILLYSNSAVYEPTAEEVFIYAPDQSLMIRCRPQDRVFTRMGDITKDLEQKLGYTNLRACFTSVYNGRVKPEGYGTIWLNADPVVVKVNRNAGHKESYLF